MASRSIASLSLSFGLVSIPVKVYTATASEAAIRFKLLGRGGARVRQQYVADALLEPEQPVAGDDGAMRSAGRSRPLSVAPDPQRDDDADGAAAPNRNDDDNDDDDAAIGAPQPAPFAARTPSDEGIPDHGLVGRSDMVKGYEFEKGRFVVFSPAELAALAGASRQTIDIVAFIPTHAVDPIYYDKAYFLAPDKGGGKPYALLLQALRQSGRRALAKWAWRAKEYVVEIRPESGGLVLQQLRYADEVRSLDALKIELAEVSPAEMTLALQLIAQNATDAYDPSQFVDEEKQRILAAIERKVAGKEVLADDVEPGQSAQVIDLMAALRASLAAPLAAALPRAASEPLKAATGSSKAATGSSKAATASSRATTARPRSVTALPKPAPGEGLGSELGKRKPVRRAASKQPSAGESTKAAGARSGRNG